jgi:uncharacterized phage protein (TIGR01671 family)
MNNRQLKFRVWDKLEKRFIYPDKGYQGHYVLSLDGKFHNLQNGSGGDECVVQQFIGITDKNKKEIFEGDVVSFDGFSFKQGVVSYLNGYSTYVIDVDKALIQIPNIDFETFEVVGNIFELPCNPDHNGECLVCDCWLSDCPFNKQNDSSVI